MKIINLIIICLLLSIHNVKTDFNQLLVNDLDEFLSPIQFTSNGVDHFLTKVFNHQDYGRVILPHTYKDFIDFLSHGYTNKQPVTFDLHIVRLFGLKSKETQYINAYNFSQMLNELPDLLAHRFTYPKKGLSSVLHTVVKNILFDNFLKNFNLFKQDPHAFLDDLATQIVTAIEQKDADQENRVDQLRQQLVRFLELSLTKLIWSPEDNEDTWKSVKLISVQLAELNRVGILNNTDDLNDLYWSLIHRFCYFLELMGDQLPQEFFSIVKKDLVEQSLLLFPLEEFEENITTKADFLARAVVDAQSRALARANSLL